jgi:hypothetical protein
MSHIAYHASLARRDDLLRTAAERRRAAEVASDSRHGGQIAPEGARFMRRVRRALSPVGPRPAMP